MHENVTLMASFVPPMIPKEYVIRVKPDITRTLYIMDRTEKSHLWDLYLFKREGSHIFNGTTVIN